MPWFKVDDQLAFNAKVMLAGNSAMGLWVRSGSWSSAQLTGGFIPSHMANAMANALANPCDQDALVMAGLWKEAEGGYQFHDWSDFQPDAEVEKEKRKATSDARSRAGKAGAEARWHGKADSKHIANEWQNDAPVPSRPDPTEEAKASSSEIPRPDVDGIIRGFSKLLEANDVKHKPGQTWHAAARLLIDKDGYTPEQIMFVAKFATTDDFWKSNVLSVPKLREKFEALKIKAQTQGKASTAKPTTSDKMRNTIEQAQALQDRMDQQNPNQLQIGA